MGERTVGRGGLTGDGGENHPSIRKQRGPKKMSSISENADRLTCLPEEITSHILSLIPIRLAVQTCILSKRWRYTWTLLKKLDFNDYPLVFDRDSLTKFVDTVLEGKTSHIELFRIHFSNIWVRNSSVSKWINEAIRLNVREVDIQVKLLELPLSLFTCKTLTKLRLIVSCYDSDVLNFPSQVLLPCLKTLEISVMTKPSMNAFKLINGCPILESLSLEVTWHNDKEEYNFNIPTLKRLELRTLKCVSVINRVVLNVPNLEYLFVGNILCSLSCSTSRVDVLLNSPMPKFPNLKHLELKGSCCEWLSMFNVLENSSELEHLSIDEPEESLWVEPQLVPTCMLSKLKTMKFRKCKGQKWDLQFLEYMLGNSEVLKTLTIITSESLRPKKEMLLCAELLKFPRASRSCEIHFAGNWSHSTFN
ncbi:hypothetical protein L2E82_21551 [Cichorium intybus]|uniref:Uncharacterized protein n=1 Tax=Cichorium intybus TaxID=13427 RepID=A0ACB9DW17_CICIN|nr:hypothetical protein L2E82_21551 [Cichorium intybus]